MEDGELGGWRIGRMEGLGGVKDWENERIGRSWRILDLGFEGCDFESKRANNVVAFSLCLLSIRISIHLHRRNPVTQENR